MGEFSRRISRYGRDLPRAVNMVKRAAAVAIDQTVTVATPVDTGRARSNWMVGLGAKTSATREPLDRSGAGAISSATAAINRSLEGQTIYLSNNLPYIDRLNDGFSAQAPAGYVQTSVRRAVAAVRAKVPTFIVYRGR